MVDLVIRNEQLAQRLLTLAATENRGVEALLDDMLRAYQAHASELTPLQRLAQIAAEADLTFTATDTAERSREILDNEFADYLMKRRLGDHDEDTRSG